MNEQAASFNRARSVFEELVEAPQLERQARLEALGEEEPELASQVLALLAADRSAGGDGDGPLDQPVGRFAGTLVEDWLAHEQMPTRVGPYRVVSLLGRGGMGEVFLAERADGQFEQEVALKLMRRGLDSAEIVRRFYRERQILARLEHPNIARLLDGGLADDGRPYFALERVAGESILVYAAEHQLDVEARLRLLVTACRAVDAAHRQLIVHRDLKPAHILVTVDGTVKLLDFGIAKLLEEELGPEGATALDHRALTPSYAAPEQILGEPVATTTDVYALGVVLYELLTGQMPHRREARTLSELVSKVQVETAERASAALRRQAAKGDVEAKLRARRLSGDLDTILSQALKRDPEYRYPSAGALADDLERHLAGRPVKAQPDSWRYRASKFIGRHRWAMAAGLAATLALCAALVWALVEGRRASASARLAETQAAAARAQAERTERVKEFLLAVFREANPMQRQREQPMTAREVLERGIDKARSELASEPALQAEVLGDLASTLSGLDTSDRGPVLLEEAVELARRGTGPDSLLVAKLHLSLASSLVGRQSFARAEELTRGALSRLDPSLGAGSREAARAKALLVLICGLQGRMEEALPLAREAVALFDQQYGPDHPDSALQRISLAEVLRSLGQLDEAEENLRWVLPRLAAAHGPGHLRVALARLNLASLITQQGKLRQAEPLLDEARGQLERAAGERDGAHLNALLQLGRVQLQLGKVESAETAFSRVLALRQAMGHVGAAAAQSNLGWMWIARGRLDRAAAAFESARTLLANAGQRESSGFELATLGLGYTALLSDQAERAAGLIRPAADRLEQLAGPEGDEMLQTLRFRGELDRHVGRIASASEQHRRALALGERRLRGDHPTLAELALQLAADLVASGDPATRPEAEALLARSRASFATLDPAHPRLSLLAATEKALRRLP